MMKTSPMQTVSKESWGGYINIKKMFKTKSITKDKERQFIITKGSIYQKDIS